MLRSYVININKVGKNKKWKSCSIDNSYATIYHTKLCSNSLC